MVKDNKKSIFHMEKNNSSKPRTIKINNKLIDLKFVYSLSKRARERTKKKENVVNRRFEIRLE